MPDRLGTAESSPSHPAPHPFRRTGVTRVTEDTATTIISVAHRDGALAVELSHRVIGIVQAAAVHERDGVTLTVLQHWRPLIRGVQRLFSLEAGFGQLLCQHGSQRSPWRWDDNVDRRNLTILLPYTVTILGITRKFHILIDFVLAGGVPVVLVQEGLQDTFPRAPDIAGDRQDQGMRRTLVSQVCDFLTVDGVVHRHAHVGGVLGVVESELVHTAIRRTVDRALSIPGTHVGVLFLGGLEAADQQSETTVSRFYPSYTTVHRLHRWRQWWRRCAQVPACP